MERLRQHLTPRNLIVALVALLLIGLSVPIVPLAVSGPTVVSIAPADGAADANPQAPIRVEFDQWVSLASVASAVRFDPPIEFTVGQAEAPRPWRSVMLIQPKDSLRYGARYQLTLDGSVRNMLGRGMAAPQTVAFATAPYVMVARSGPEQGAQKVALNAPITVEFGAPVVPAERVAAAAEDAALADALPQPLVIVPEAKGVGRWLSPTLYGFYPNGGLHAATEYQATVRTDITSDGQARLEQAFTWRFTTEAPLLASARPYDGATEVPADGPVEVRLAPDVDADSAGQHFALADAETGTPVEGTITRGGGGFLFAPAAPLQRGVRYEARLKPGVQTLTGKPLNASPLTWTFTVIGDLEVVQAEPVDGTLEVPTDARRISVRFNHPVVAITTIDAQNTAPPLRIDPPVQGVGRWLDTSTYVLSPTADLAPATSYRMTIAAGLQDQTGGALRQPYEWTFTTAAPQIVETSPVAGEQQAGPDKPIEVFFNQPMDPASLRTAITLLNGAGAGVPGTLAFASSRATFQRFDSAGNQHQINAAFVATFKPAAPLDRGATYTLAVGTRARATQGSGTLASEYRSTFRIAPLPQFDKVVPDTTAAPGSGTVVVSFNTPMDWDSVWRNLTIEPKPTEVYTSGYDLQFSVSFVLQPETDYRVTVGAAAHDPYGVALGQDALAAFRTGSLPPWLALVGANRIGVYNAYVPARLPLQHVNVPSISYRLYRLDAARVPNLWGDYEAWQHFSPEDSALVKDQTLNLAGERNQQRLDLLDLGRLDAGMYYLALDGPGILDDHQILSVSPYALTIKRSPGKLFVWAVDLATGKPVSDLPLQAVSTFWEERQSASFYSSTEPRELGRTDAEGILQAPFTTASDYDPVFLWSPAGGSRTAPTFAFGLTGWSEGISPWDFGLPAVYEASHIAGNLATDRPIYRPDQNVYIRGVLRMDDDGRYSLPDTNRRAHLTINDPEGNTVLSTTLQLSEFGTFNTSFPLAGSAKLGGYSLSAQLDDVSMSQAFYGSFIVAEYRKPAFEIAVTPAKDDLIQGETLDASVSARYYSGGALANAPVRWRLLANPLYFGPDTAPNYRFEDLDDAYEWYRWFDNQREGGGEQVAEGKGQTDAQGHFSVQLPATLGKDNHSRRLTLDVEISDVDGQVIASSANVNVHAGAFYIGLRPEGYVARAGQPQPVSIITLDPHGQPIGNRALSVKVYKREWFSVREQGGDGRFYFTSSYTDTLTEQLSATTDAQGRASVSFTPKEGGSYRIGAEGRDDAGHTIKASAFTWATGDDVFWGINDTARVDLIADKDSYKPGDTAGILVTAPYKDMTALMTIERGQVIEHKLLTIRGTTQLLQVPITADYAPNVYVSLVLIKPAGGDVPVPDLRVGLVELPVSTEQQELTVSVTPDKTQAGPRDQVTYTVKATDYSGKGVKAEVALALVDKAVLALADDANPTLRRSFYEKRPIGVFTAQSLTALVDRVTLKLQPGDKGGGGGLDSDVLVRRDFPDTAYWNPALVTGDDGLGSVIVTLPDSLTTWRMSARAVTANTLVGQAAEDIVATRPLLVRPALPRFLTLGDQPVIQAVIHNSTTSAIDASVQLDLVTPEGASPTLKLDGPAQQNVNVPASGTAVVRWPAEVTAAGQATLRFTLNGGGMQDITERALPIQRYTTPEVVASAGQVRDTPVVEALALPTGLPQATDATTSTQGEVELDLEPSLAAGIGSGLSYLEHYPYLCAEQTVSRFLPNAVTYRLFRQIGRDDPNLKTALDRNLTAGLQRLYTLQNLDGGWGWWSDDKSDPYLTTYVAQGLVEARRAGYGVDAQVFDKAMAYLESALNEELRIENAKGSGQTLLNSQFSILNSRSYVLFVLAEAGRPDRGRTVALFDQRAKLQIYGKAYLLMTLKSLGSEDTRIRTLVGELMGAAILHTTDAHWEEGATDYWTMSSNTRTTALALQALVRADPDNFLVPNAVRYLMGPRGAGADAPPRLYPYTTQELATTLMALSEYIAQSGELEADYSYTAALDGKLLREGKVDRDNLDEPISVVFDLAALKAGGQSQLLLQRQGDKGKLYYTLRMRYYQDAAQAKPLDQGVGVQREYMAVDTATLSVTGQLVTQAKLGDLVQVRLTLTVPVDMPYFAAEDMLPAGLEALDSSLKTVGAAAENPDLSEVGVDYPYWWFFSQTEIHDNRVALFATSLPKGTYHYTYLARATTIGTFQTLPATAYRMYSPEVFGRSAGAKFVVTEN